MKNLILALITLALGSCSSMPHKRTEILARGDSIAVLEEKLEQALLSDVNILAPIGFSKAQRLFDKAVREAEKSKDPAAGNQTALNGIAVLDEAERSAEQNRPILGDTLVRRANAKLVEADTLFADDFEKLDRQLSTAAKALEEGKQQEGIGKNATLGSSYANLEMKATKENVVVKANAAYDEAVKARALRFAPVTMKKAKSEIAIAQRIIEVETGNREEAEFHAKRGRYFAKQAKNIADTLIAFHKEHLTDEGKILWFQEQLNYIHQPLATNGLPFDKPEREVAAELRDELSALVTNMKNLEHKNKTTIAEKDRALYLQKEQNAVFDQMSDLFSQSEAEVLKREDGIIIRSYGFNFPVGKSELLPDNFTLLKKIVKAIEQVPTAQIVVEGHTDSTGSATLNKNLSRQRAQNIADYLVKVAGINESRVSFVGYGFEKPLADNHTIAGRAKNRRIEVLLKN